MYVFAYFLYHAFGVNIPGDSCKPTYTLICLISVSKIVCYVTHEFDNCAEMQTPAACRIRISLQLIYDSRRNTTLNYFTVILPFITLNRAWS